MKKPTIHIEYPQPRNIQRADIAHGYALVVDGHFKTQFADEGAAKKAAAELLARYPMLQIEFTMPLVSHDPWRSSPIPALSLQQR
jgi:hypothetical protein